MFNVYVLPIVCVRHSVLCSRSKVHASMIALHLTHAVRARTDRCKIIEFGLSAGQQVKR